MQTTPRYDPLTFGEAALRLRAYRHELLSANLVNTDTPNFKAKDINFPEVLGQYLGGQIPSKSLGLVVTRDGHLKGRQSEAGPDIKFRVPVQPAVDGNTVDPDLERSHFVKNSLLTEASIQFLGSTIKTRLSAITGHPS